MKLFTKEIDKQLFAQYSKGSDLDNQMVVAKIFNPYGRGTWYLLNSDPEDPDYIWAIVDLFEVEMGSVSRSELESIKVPPFNLGLERDLYFEPVNAAELFNGLLEGKTYAKGGTTDNGNAEMLASNLKAISHHAKELENTSKGKNIEAWVVSKIERAATDLSDVTHYLDGKTYANGGELGVDRHRTYFRTFGEVMDAIHDIAKDNGYKVVEIFPDLSYGGISYGQTRKAKVELEWDGAERRGKSKKRDKNTLNVQIYRMDSGSYELNTYFAYSEGGYMAGGGKTENQFMIYKLRAEGVNDFMNFLGTGIYFNINWFKVEIHKLGLPDVVVYFETDLSLSELKSKLREVQDSHVMLQTIQPVNNYTGERYADGGLTTTEIITDKNGEAWLFPNKPNGQDFGIRLQHGGSTQSGVNLTNEMRGEDEDDYGTFELYKNGGEVEVKILNRDEAFSRSKYDWLLGDYDSDGVANVDDKKPYDKGVKEKIDSPSIEKGINTILDLKNTMDNNMYSFVDELKSISPDGSKIYARTKTPYSIIDKLIKKRLLNPKTGLTDLIGTTIVTQDKKELDAVKNEVQAGKLGKVIEVEDMYANPKQGYRAYHFLIEKNGMPVELQLKTKRQKALNELSHEPYKLGKLDGEKLIHITEVANRADNGDQEAIAEYNDFMKQPDLEKVFYKYANGGYMEGGGQADGKNGYIAFYKGKRIEVYADTKYEAQLKAAKLLNAKKSYEVNVALAELDGKPYMNSTMAKGGITGDVHSLTDKLLSQKIQIFIDKVMPIKYYYIDEKSNSLVVGLDENYTQDAADRFYREATSSMEVFDADSINMEYNSKTKDTQYVIKLKKPVKFENGGNVGFSDKVKAVKQSLLKRKKVSPKVQKDYGKTYSPSEAEASAKRIVGAMNAKERLQSIIQKRKK